MTEKGIYWIAILRKMYLYIKYISTPVHKSSFTKYDEIYTNPFKILSVV